MLTEQKLKYVALRKAGVRQKEAAIAAEYSARTAAQQASRLESDPEVREAIYGEKKTVVQEVAPQESVATDEKYYEDAKDFLLAEMNDPKKAPSIRHDAAKALLPYQHAKIGETGKKKTREDEAKGVHKNSKFTPRMVK